LISKKYAITVCMLLLTVGMIVSPNILLSLPVKAAPSQIQFTHGIASGDVTPTSAVLWTRTGQDAQVEVLVSKHPTLKKPDFKGTIHSTSATDFTAKLLAEGLKPNTLYYYRFIAGDSKSEIGIFRTSPKESKASNVRFTWSGDTDVSKINGVPVFGDWSPLTAAKLESPDFFIYLGDVIYSDVRAAGQLPDAQTLDEFRQIYKDSRDVVTLHDLLKKTSIYPLWDDHEVRSDWAGQTVDPTYFAIGKQAFDEYTPIGKLNPTSDPDCAGPTQFRVKHWGKEADLIMLDTRTCRSENVETQCHGDLVPTLPSFIRTTLPGIPAQPPAGCIAAINDPSRTMLGSEQKDLFKDALSDSKAKYKFIISSVAIQQLFANPYDAWEGYGAERSEILNFIRDNGIKNVIFLTTDLHLNLMNEVFVDRFSDPSPIASEVITGPIGAETDKDRILRTFGPALGPVLLQARENLLTLVGADCRNLDVYSYGKVTVSKVGGIAKIVLKDGDRNIIHDDVDPSIKCSKSFGLSDFPKSSSQVKNSKSTNDIVDAKKLWNKIQGDNQISESVQAIPQTEVQRSTFNPFG
jgi:alkaline phosphatase D